METPASKRTSPTASPTVPPAGGEPWRRRSVLKAISAAGIGSAAFGRALAVLSRPRWRVTA